MPKPIPIMTSHHP